MQYDGRDPIFLFGRLPSGGDVTIRIIRFPGDLAVNLSSNVCQESAHESGYWYWSTDNIDDSLPLYPNRVTLLYVMTHTQTGAQWSGKLILNDYPEEVRRNYANVQTLL